ncbi:MAG: DUF4178 domain-containing protein [Acidobacteria bacterium]|nr:DUF4178 domain-containing protein [Acidobacteriota bacterium]
MTSSGPTPAGTPQVKSLNCPSCGATLTVRSFGHAVTIVCDSCHSILDAQDPKLQILQKFEAATHEDPPLIPLGTRGSIRGTIYEAVGFQRRTIHVDGVPYSWHEYLLFNPYKGFRYLTEYNGHWNDVSVLRSLPDIGPGGSRLSYLGETFKHFQTAQAETSYVLGEFPWQVRQGEIAEVCDYVSPPRMISSEKTGEQITWSLGEYMTGRDIWQAFKLSGQPPTPIGVYENQPSPMSANVKVVWSMVGLFLLLLVALLAASYFTARNEQVFEQSYQFNSSVRGEASFVTEGFELKGHTSNVELTTTARVDNNWIYLNYALINQDTGHAYDFGREVSYYHGYDEDGSWSEGRTKDTVTLPSIPPGNYYLRVEPESAPNRGTIAYTITVKRDVPQASFFGLGVLALLVPAGLITWRSLNFEHLRWAESGDGDAFKAMEKNLLGSIQQSISGEDDK